MANTTINVVIYGITCVIAGYLGVTLRKWRDRSLREKLVKEVEAALNQSLPHYQKKGQHLDPINWERVLNDLKKLPDNYENQKLIRKVELQIQEIYKARFRKR